MPERLPIFCCAALWLISSALSAETIAKGATAVQGTYTGEVVVHAIGRVGLAIAVDEAGAGLATRTFLVTTAHPLPALDLRSANGRVERRSDGLYVALPSERRLLVFSTATREVGRAADTAGSRIQSARRDFAWTGLEVTEIGGVTELAEYRGKSDVLMALDEVERGRVPTVLRVVAAAGKVPENQPGPTPGDGSGCQTSCNATCGNGSSCTLTCAGGRCGTCTCVPNYGASCSCF